VGRQPARVPATPVRQLVFLLLKRVATTWPRTGAVAHAATRYHSNERAGAAEIERTKHARDRSEASRLAVAQARLLAVSETFRALVEIHIQVYGRDATSSSNSSKIGGFYLQLSQVRARSAVVRMRTQHCSRPEQPRRDGVHDQEVGRINVDRNGASTPLLTRPS
jgi:hypothetical protein